MNPWIPHLLRAGGGGGGAVLPPAGRTMLANLKSSLILDEGTGDPTWSRATKAWGFNELGYLEELASGCAFFGGARLVRNTVRTKSEDFSNAAWKKTNITTPSANVVVCANATSQQLISQETGAPAIGSGIAMSFNVRVKYIAGGVSYLQLLAPSTAFGTSQWASFSLLDGSVVATGVQVRSVNLGGGTFEFSIRSVSTGAGNEFFSVLLANSISDTRGQSYVGDGVKSFELLRAWSVDVTNYDVSYIPEYVSVGVLSAPFHGAGIDGAKYFETDWQGAPLPAASLLGFRREASATNNLLWSRDLTKQSSAVLTRWSVTQTSSAEIVANNSFDSDLTNWSASIGAGDTISATGGNCTLIFSGSVSSTLDNSATLTIGKTYVLVIVATGTGSCKFQSTLEITGIGAGTTTKSFVATGTAIRIARTSGIACNLVVESISIKEAAVQCSLTATGLDGIANSATTLTASAADAIILQPITLASAARCASAYVKRRTGTGTISFTQDGGSTWTDITAQINGSTWSRVEITSTLADPSVGFKISTSGDEIDVDCVQNEAGAVATSPIVTTTAAVTRNADSLTYQTASNWSDTAGTAYIEAQPLSWVAGGAIGSATNGLLLSAANSGATASDGTNTANGPAGTPSGRKKLALRWGGGAMTVASGGVVGTPGTYDGAMGLASIGIAVNSSTYCGPVAIYNYQMTDAELQAITA